MQNISQQLSLFSLPGVTIDKLTLTVPTIEQQTGWKRMFPQRICQEPLVLMQITAFDYDLRNEAFQQYCRSRIGYDGHAPDQKLFEQYCNHRLTKTQFFESWRVVGKYGHQDNIGRVLDDEELESKWKSFIIHKGKFQDCWELWVTLSDRMGLA